MRLLVLLLAVFIVSSCQTDEEFIIVEHRTPSYTDIPYYLEILQTSPQTVSMYDVLVKESDIDNLAETTWNPHTEQYVITFDKDLSEDSIIHIVAHEWAHILTWDIPNARNHGPEFGVAMSRCLEALWGEGPSNE